VIRQALRSGELSNEGQRTGSLREALAMGYQALTAAAGGVRNVIPNRLKAFIKPMA
jgi:hypothetical protein